MKKFLFLFALFIAGCYYDTEEELYPTIECATQNVSYSETVLPIIRDNCYACHDAANNFGNITVEGYDLLINFVNNGQLLGVIRHESGYSPMPKNVPMLLECEIEKIEAWVNAGAMNN